MCELMGMSFARPVLASVSIQAFSQRSQENADGWGLAWEWHLDLESCIAIVNLGSRPEKLGIPPIFNTGKPESSGDNPAYPV